MKMAIYKKHFCFFYVDFSPLSFSFEAERDNRTKRDDQEMNSPREKVGVEC